MKSSVCLKNGYLSHPVMGYEVVLNNKGQIVTDSLNAGTYNFYNPTMGSPNILLRDNGRHTKYDVIPYYKYSNSSDDPTTDQQRLLRTLKYIY